MLNITQIPAPRVELIDPRTGLMSREWFRFFNNIYTVVGANQGVIQTINGGTGLDAIPTNGQLLIGNNGAYELDTLTAGAGATVTNGAGTITIANSGVLSTIAGTGVSVSSATGAVTIANTGALSFSAGTTGLTPSSATTGAITLAGTLAITSGGTDATDAATARTNLGLGTMAVRDTGATGSFTTVDSQTVTVVAGIITSIV